MLPRPSSSSNHNSVASSYPRTYSFVPCWFYYFSSLLFQLSTNSTFIISTLEYSVDLKREVCPRWLRAIVCSHDEVTKRQGCTNPGRHVARAKKFPNVWVISVELLVLLFWPLGFWSS